MKKFLYYQFLIISIFLFSFNFTNATLLQNTNDMENQADWLSSYAELDSSASVGSIVATVISAFLALLGIIFVVLILIAGYNWMTALGDEEKVTKAKNTLQRAIIGLIIIVAAYAITYFVFNKLPWGETSTSSSNNTGTGGSSVGGEVNNTTDNNDNDDSIINEISPINK